MRKNTTLPKNDRRPQAARAAGRRARRRHRQDQSGPVGTQMARRRRGTSNSAPQLRGISSGEDPNLRMTKRGSGPWMSEGGEWLSQGDCALAGILGRNAFRDEMRNRLGS